MQDVYDAHYVTLHVRVSNKAACHLYKGTLGYECVIPPTFAVVASVPCLLSGMLSRDLQ